MTRSKFLTIPAVVAGALGLGAGAVHAAEPTTEDLMKQIQQLQNKVQQLESNQQTLATKDVDTTVEAVLKDADQRSQLLQMEGFTAGYNKGKFLIQSADGNFVFHPWLQMQFRGNVSYQNMPGGHDINSGFEMRRMKFGFDGNMFSPANTYLFNWATDRNTGLPNLEEAWFRWGLTDQWSVRGGQIKDPFAHESIMSSKYFMAAERDLLTDLFTGGDNYVDGVSVMYSEDAWQGEVALTNGQNQNNKNFQDFPTNMWDFGVAGRVQYKVMGDWDAYNQFSAMGVKNDLLVIGGGVDWSEGGHADQFLHTFDVQYDNTTGLGLYGAAYGRYTRKSPKGIGVAPAAENDTYDWGFVAQASYMINPQWEPFARYDFIHFDTDTVPSGGRRQIHEITGGVNYYVHGQAMKFTLDVTYLPDGSAFTDSGADIFAGNKCQLLVRGQFQLLI